MSAAESEPIGAEEARRLLGAPLAGGAVLAVSGGPDSMALLGLAAEQRDRLPQRPDLLAVTVDHGLRPESADEARLAGEAAEALGIRHRTLVWRGDKPRSGLHAAARQARYRLLVEAAREAGLPRILTAHHLDDQAETVLMRLKRGREPRALAAIAPVVVLAENLRVERPFLDVRRARLHATVERMGLPYVRDPSNADWRFERARLRALMPVLDAAGLTARRLAALAESARAAAERIERAAIARLERDASVDAYGRVSGSLEILRAPEIVALAVLRRIVMATGGRTDGPDVDALAGTLKRLRSGAPGTHAYTLHGVRLAVEGGRGDPLVTASREWGRCGPGRRRPAQKGVTVWDGRFRVASAAVPEGAEIRPFGSLGRGAPHERAMPALFVGEVCVAVPPALRKAPAGACGAFEPDCIVRERLLAFHIGGLADRLALD